MIKAKNIELGGQQQEVVDEAVSNFLSCQSSELSIGGLAGTGKSTIAQRINYMLTDAGMKVVTLCPTGKAANVLRKKGVTADTIHSAIYNFKGKYKDSEGEEFLSWENKDSINGSPDLLMIDESSMVNGRLARDLRDLNIPILWIGDHGQLPPVGADPGIMRHPDFILEKNYRQGKSEIVDYALAIREGLSVKTSREVKQYSSAKWAYLMQKYDPDQAILGFNSSRVKYNRLYRKLKGYKDELHEGEKIICVQNNRRMFLFNGMQFIVKKVINIGPLHITADIAEVDRPELAKTVRLRRIAFNSEKYDTDDLESDELVADYGYGITCHKAQGSEWDNVLVFNQSCRAWDQERWLYTAATRAAKQLTVVG